MMLRNSSLASLMAAAILFLVSPAQAQAVAHYDLPSQPLATALRTIGSQTSTNVLFDPPLLEGRYAPALKAELSLDQAFTRVLAGSGLKHRFLDDKTVMVISAAATEPVKPTARVPGAGLIRLAQSDQTNPAQSSTAGQSAQNTESKKSDSAAEESDFKLEEVVVTAQKRVQNIQDVGVAVSALGQQALRSFDTNDSAALAIAVPSLQVRQYSQSLVIINIRGVAQNDVNDFQEGPNAFYNDEVYISSLGAIAGQMFDLQRVEVLRGPQGTLFGRNATGGLVQVVTARPTRDWEGFLTVTGGDNNQLATEGAIGGPLSDSVSARLSVTSDYHDGYFHSLNPAIGDAGEGKFSGARLQFLFDLSPHDTLLLKGEYLHNDHEIGPVNSNVAMTQSPIGTALGPTDNYWGDLAANPFVGAPIDPNVYLGPGRNWQPGGTPFGYVYPTGAFDFDTNLPPLFDREFSSFTGRYEHDFGNVTLTSISNYQKLDKTTNIDVDGSPFSLLEIESAQDLKQWSQEFRLAGQSERMNWVGGVYVLNIDTFLPADVVFQPVVNAFFADKFGQQFAFNDLGGSRHRESTQNTDSGAIFGQFDYKLNNTFTLVAGARYSHDKKDYQFTAVGYDVFGAPYLAYDFRNRLAARIGTEQPFPFPIVTYDFSADAPDLSTQKFNSWSGKLQLEARLNSDTLLYVGVNRGTKSGGFNGPLALPTDIDPAEIVNPDTFVTFNRRLLFDEEVLTNYETGFKLTLADGRLNLNGSLFHYDYDGYQAFTIEQGSVFIQNLPAKITGVELEFQAHPLDAVTLGGFLTYMIDATAKDVPLPSIDGFTPGEVKDQDLPQTPTWSIGLQAAYKFQLASLGALTLSTNWKYDSEQYLNLFNGPAVLEPGHTIGNVRAALAIGDHVELAAFVNNVTDERYRVYGSGNGDAYGAVQFNYGRPRWAGASVTYRFGK